MGTTPTEKAPHEILEDFITGHLPVTNLVD